MEKKQSQTPDLEIKKAPKSLTEQDLNTISGGKSNGDGSCHTKECDKGCSSK